MLLAAMVAQALPAGLASAQPARPEAPPPAMTDEARAFYERGLRHYADKNYAAAIGEFHAGYAVEPRREFLFAEAQAKRLSGDCPGAVGLYQKFLETQPSAAQVNATQMGLARCAQQMAATPAPSAATPREAPPPVATAPPSTPPSTALPAGPPAPPSPRAQPWFRDAPGTALLGAGVLSLGVGGGFLAASFAARGSASSYDDYHRQWQTVEGRWKVAMVGLVAGGLLTGAAIARYALVRRRAH
ncbi:MAG TPA: hypothetical protein VFH73_08740, partial [Polyangia bacterium]|nr:hypothetical protein [Polyangia bacterium]